MSKIALWPNLVASMNVDGELLKSELDTETGIATLLFWNYPADTMNFTVEKLIKVEVPATMIDLPANTPLALGGTPA